MKLKLMLVAVLFLSGCGMLESTDTSGTTDQIDVKVTQVIDGDTIKIIYEGEEVTVRYLLIDTPETNHPRLGKQPLGSEATEENRRLIESGDVSIEFDVGDRFDDYDRLLAYIYVDGESVQEQMLASGLARVAYVFPQTHVTRRF
ncbi:thermonuclease family protein [Planococcus faecalis]|uniref:thermonuclease family protein n=1 Tax=Planococcus faecalis TaxID=1598147 RepID=UPI000AA4827F